MMDNILLLPRTGKPSLKRSLRSMGPAGSGAAARATHIWSRAAGCISAAAAPELPSTTQEGHAEPLPRAIAARLLDPWHVCQQHLRHTRWGRGCRPGKSLADLKDAGHDRRYNRALLKSMSEGLQGAAGCTTPGRAADRVWGGILILHCPPTPDRQSPVQDAPRHCYMAPAHRCICEHLPCIARDPERAGQALGHIPLVIPAGHGPEALRDLVLVHSVGMSRSCCCDAA
jgi:hypothetical protein